MVVLDYKCGERVPVQIGTKVIEHLVVTRTEKELQQAGKTWKQVYLSTVVSKRYTMKGLDGPEYDLKGVKGKISTIKEVVIPPFKITVVKGLTNLMTHSKCLTVVVEPVTGYSEHIVMARSNRVLKLERGKIDVCLRNNSAKQITLLKWTAVGEITAANIILVLLVPKSTGNEYGKEEPTA